MTAKPFPIVAVGASAGGVEALSALFRALPAQPGAAFVVVTHLTPHRDSLLPDILARCTPMPVATAEDGSVLEPNRVYLNAPDSILAVRGAALAQAPREHEHNPIDIFLSSLANEAGERAIAAILSGTGSDGALGVTAVRQAGGFTLAQGHDFGQASHSGMPDAAVATGFVDCVLPIGALAERIASYASAYTRSNLLAPDEAGAMAGDVEAAKAAIFSILRYRVGHDFSRYKEKTVLRRVERRMQVRQISDIDTYIALIKSEPEEVTLLFRDLLIGVTNFFRDPEAFAGLSDLVIPHLFEGKSAGDPIRVWVPGCATGEEAYSIAMLLREAMATAPVQLRVQIFATDIDENALAIARTGCYPASLLEPLSPERRERHFIREGKNYVAVKELRDLCLFSAHSVVRDPPFSQIDLISCRNLLIYFKVDLQSQVIPLFHYALKPGGFLFLGASENVSQHPELFEPLDKRHRLFLRREISGRPPLFPLLARQDGKSQGFQTAAANTARGSQDMVRLAGSMVLDTYAPAYVLIDADLDISHYSGRAGKFFEAPSGPPSRNLLTIARRGLRLPLRSAVQEALASGQPAKRENVEFELEGHAQNVDIVVDFLPEGGGPQQLVVLFIELGPMHKRDDAAPPQPVEGEGALLLMERELLQTREQLQISIEEYETSVEELKSANEELLSVNEELQSSNEELENSKEELQSVNEELHAVNKELAVKVDELDRANNDLKNIFNSTQIATVFLDRNLIIRNFTPAMSEVFRLIPGDRGRALSDIVAQVDARGVLDDFAAAVSSEQTIERNISRLDGSAHYLMRIVPYRDTDNAVNGGVATFVNVTAMVEAEEHQRLLVAELNHRVKNVLAVVSSMAAQMERRCATVDEFARNFIDRIQGLSRTHDILSRNEWSDVSLAQVLGAELDAFLAESGRATLDGPEVWLTARTVTTLGMVFHELATNAVKYGALSTASGTVAVQWRREEREGAAVLVLIWRESGGPPVQPPQRSGFGTEWILRSLDYELGGAASIDYPAAGVVATLTIPFAGYIVSIGEGGKA